MELKLINSNKLKVMLTGRELSDYSLSCDTIDYDNTETRRAFWSIFDEAKHKTGFDAAKEKVYIQVYPLRDGGCEIYVTKTDAIFAGSDVKFDVGRDSSERMRVYCFANLDTLSSACRAVYETGFDVQNAAVFCDDYCYYLKLELKTVSGELTQCPVLSEFGCAVECRGFDLYSKEYCKELCCENVLEYFAKLA